MLSQSEANKLADAFGRVRGNRKYFKEEWRVIERWGIDTAMNHSLLENILSGRLLVDVNGGEIVFTTSVAGGEAAEKLVKENPEAKALWKGLDAGGFADKPKESWPATGSLCGRILFLLYHAPQPMDRPVMSAILGVPEEATALALVSLKDRGLIGNEPKQP